MKTPEGLQALPDEGLIDGVMRQPTSGKEATVYVFRCAKVYKGATQRSFRQGVDAAGNNHAQCLLQRDVGNLRDFFGRFSPELLASRYGEEIWDLCRRGMLQPDTVLSGRFEHVARAVNLGGVLREIDDARAEEAARRLRMQPVH